MSEAHEFAFRHAQDRALRIMACGDAGDGTSTLIRRSLEEFGGRRSCVVVDGSSGRGFPRDVVTGTFAPDLAVMPVDAAKGLVPQTRRDIYIASLLGIPHVALIVDKLDLAHDSQDAFGRIEAESAAFADRIGLKGIVAIPVSAVGGDNAARRASKTPWYRGPSLLEYLDGVPVEDHLASQPFRMSVASVPPADADSRAIAGTIVSGNAQPGDRIRVLPSGHTSRVSRIVGEGGDLPCAEVDQAITLVLEDGIEAGPGDVVCKSDEPVEAADGFEATLVWMGRMPMLPGRSYLMKIGTKTVATVVAPLKYKVNVDSLEHVAASRLESEEVGVVQLELDQPVAFEPFERNRRLGGFLLVDPIEGDTVGAGMIRFPLRRAQNVHWQAVLIDRAARAALKGQKPCVVWLTGLSASGKSTIANLLEKRLHAMGRHTYLLDGDNVRHGLNKDLGFTEAARVENIRRIAEVAKLMADAGLIVLTAFISPFRAERRMARALFPDGEFIEVFVDVPLAVAEARDPKGLYRKARRGELKNFTGIDSPYEPPEHAEIRIDASALAPEEAVEAIVEEMRARARLPD